MTVPILERAMAAPTLGKRLPPPESPHHRQAPHSPHTVHSTTQLLLQQDSTVFQGIQLALNGVYFSMDILLGDVLVGLDLPNSTQSPVVSLPSHLSAARSFPLASAGLPDPVPHPMPWVPVPSGMPRGRHNFLLLLATSSTLPLQKRHHNMRK